jgi:hypothetical protein
VPRPRTSPALPPPQPPLQRGAVEGITVVAGHNGVVVFNLRGASASLRAIVTRPGTTYGCFRFMRYHEAAPAELGFERQTMRSAAIRIFGLPTPYDGCEIEGSYGHRWPDRNHSHSPVEVAFSARGRRFFADRAAARGLALFVRSREVQRIRRLGGHALASALGARYGGHITRLGSVGASLGAGRIGYVIRRDGASFVERSTTGRRLVVTVKHGRIVKENVNSLAFVF